MIALCSVCGETKQRQTANVSKKTGLMGYRSYCIDCHKVKKKAMYENNKEYVLAKNKEWLIQNPDKRAQITRRYNERNKEKCAEWRKQWRLANPEKAKTQVNHRRRHLRNARPRCLTKQDLDIMRDLYFEAAKLKMHVDHIVPLQHEKVCGLHVPWNLQLLTPEENYAKSNKFY